MPSWFIADREVQTAGQIDQQPGGPSVPRRRSGGRDASVQPSSGSHCQPRTGDRVAHRRRRRRRRLGRQWRKCSIEVAGRESRLPSGRPSRTSENPPFLAIDTIATSRQPIAVEIRAARDGRTEPGHVPAGGLVLEARPGSPATPGIEGELVVPGGCWNWMSCWQPRRWNFELVPVEPLLEDPTVVLLPRRARSSSRLGEPAV